MGDPALSCSAMNESLERVTASWGHAEGAWSILVHGGAGEVDPARIPAHVAGCRRAADAGAEVLRAGGSALDAVQRAVTALEDDPSFNAGTGACLNADGEIELDASIMEGASLRAGAVCALPPFKNPIGIARAVLEDGRHVLYADRGAERFALQHGFVRAASAEMTTERARATFEKARAKQATEGWAGGTVGAVARDSSGHVAAATSTGGRVNKAVGRVGDSPILGAGNYADDEGGACSNTGDGEAVMRVCLAKAAIDWLRAGQDPHEAARAAIELLGRRAKGAGGIILVDCHGRLGLARNTHTMTWAAASDTLGDIRGGS
jgi:beta-aspartyl-peptidase (threonine type)